MQTSQWQDFDNGVSAKVNEIIDNTADMVPGFLGTGLWKSVKADSISYNTEGVSGLGYLQIFDENASIKEDETSPQYKTNYVPKQFGTIVSISQLLMETRDSELEDKLDEVKQARIAANMTQEQHAWQVLVDSFSTTDSDSNFPISRLSDAVSMFSTAHPSRVSGVANRSNRVASNPVLSETSLFTATKMIREQLNGRGKLMGSVGGFTLVVPPALEKNAQIFTNSVKRSGTADNDLNFYDGLVTTVVAPRIGAAAGGSDTAWFLFANDAMNLAMRYVYLIEPKIEKDSNFRTKAIDVSIDGAWAMGYSSFESCAGSDGTAT